MQETRVWSLGWDPSWRRKWRRKPTPVFLLGKSHGHRSLAGYSLWGRKRVRHNLATKQQQTTAITIIFLYCYLYLHFPWLICQLFSFLPLWSCRTFLWRCSGTQMSCFFFKKRQNKTCIFVSALQLTCSVILGKSFALFGLQFPKP